MAEIVYKASLEKFVESLTPEQMVFLGSLIEKDIQKKDFVLLDELANMMFTRVQHFDVENLHRDTVQKFSQVIIENNKPN